MPIAAIVPRTVDTAAELRAIKKLLNKEVHKASDSKKELFIPHERKARKGGTFSLVK
jgi:hypothetical protein